MTGAAPRIPPELTSLASTDVGELYAGFAAYAIYLSEHLAYAEIAEAEAEAFFEHVKAEVRLGKSGTVADKNAKMINDSRYIDAEKTHLVAHAKARLLRARTNGYREFRDVLSREISRRQGDREREVR